MQKDNAYQSNCRIEIECAFGALVKRWGILQRTLPFKLKNIKILLFALFKLHNVCMEAGIPYELGRVMEDVYAGE